MDDYYRFRCPSCGRKVKAKREQVGKKAHCSCGHVMLVPTPLETQTMDGSPETPRVGPPELQPKPLAPMRHPDPTPLPQDEAYQEHDPAHREGSGDDEDDYDDGRRRRRSRDDEDDEHDDRSRRGGSRDDEGDDYDDRPRRGRSRDDEDDEYDDRSRRQGSRDDEGDDYDERPRRRGSLAGPLTTSRKTNPLKTPAITLLVAGGILALLALFGTLFVAFNLPQPHMLMNADDRTKSDPGRTGPRSTS